MERRIIPMFKVFMPPEDSFMARMRDILYSGQISEGEPVVEFENVFADYVENKKILSFYSGTAALHAALVLAGVRPGDDVISTAMTAEPTNMAIKHAQASIVWADVDPNNGNMSPASLRESITPRTKAILPVHYGGIPVDIDEIRSIAEEFCIPVIEDAAHALGAKYNGKPLGSHSEYVMFSLQAIKHMTTVDGGMLTCPSEEKVTEGRIFRWFGIDRKASRTSVDVKTVGWKYHMNNVTASIGLAQMDYVHEIVGKYIENGKYFDRELAGLTGIDIPRFSQKAEPSYWFYTLLSDDRDKLSAHLEAHGIANSQLHKRNDQHTVFASSARELPGLDSYFTRMTHIPCGWWLSNEDREYIVEVIKKGW